MSATGTRCNAPRVPHVPRLPLRPTAVHGHGRRSHSLDLSDVRCITTRRCGSPAPTPSHRRGPPRRPRDTTSPLCHRPLRLCPPQVAASASALHTHPRHCRVLLPHPRYSTCPRGPSRRAPRCSHLCLAARCHALCAPHWSRHSHPRAAHLCTLRMIRAIARPAPRCPVPEIAFVQHWHARPQYRHDRPSTTIVFVESHCTSHSPVSARIASYTVNPFVTHVLIYSSMYPSRGFLFVPINIFRSSACSVGMGFNTRKRKLLLASHVFNHHLRRSCRSFPHPSPRRFLALQCKRCR
jgi:hypothetical protein